MKHDIIGIIGLGFVGGAIKESLLHAMYPVLVHDPQKGYSASYEELAECSGIFVCVPSPSKDNGECDTSILEEVLDQLWKVNYRGVIISKSTAPPSIYDKLQKLYPNLVHVPEFLTAANAADDYANGTFVFIGGSVPAYMREAERIVKMTQHKLQEIKFCSIGEAALAKYTINSFMATKVVFMNEVYQLAKAMGYNYDVVANMIKADTRIGKSHLAVPGPDGSLGFGGACFPKDTAAMISFAKEKDIELNVLNSAVKKNLILRLQEPK